MSYQPGDTVEIPSAGFVTLHSTYLTDEDIVEIARVSTGSGLKGEDRDKPFIDYLYRHEHLSPFGFPQMTFKIKAPIFVARQLFRHRMAQVNELSGRYTEMPEEVFVPDLDRIQQQGKDNRQGSGEPIDPEVADEVRMCMLGEVSIGKRNYEGYLSRGVSKEIARINLPLSQYTVFYWQQDLRNLLHMVKLRIDSHAQPEIQAYGNAVYAFAKEAFPWTVEAFEKHSVEAVTFNRDEIRLLRMLMENMDEFEYLNALTEDWKGSHRKEFLRKLWPNLDK